ncbi:MAG: response regulator [Candidatus Sumerlaeota bacterium]|nr:response regulator [Candidatus Sumerlaeota bacterium]
MEKKTILLADDEEDIKVVVRLYLESRGFNITTAFDGLDAIEQIERDKPDLILLDVMMPVMNGYEVAARVRANPAIKDTPIIMLSAATHEEAVKKGMEAGANDYLMKPFEPAKLEETILKYLK